MLRMLTGLVMSPVTVVLKLLALWRRNRAESFRVSYMSDAQYRVRVEFQGMCIDLPSEQAGRLASALEPGSDGPGSFGSRQGLHWIRWHRKSVRIQRPAEVVVEEAPGAASGVWLNKRSAINLGVAITEALHCHCGLCDKPQRSRHIAKSLAPAPRTGSLDKSDHDSAGYWNLICASSIFFGGFAAIACGMCIGIPWFLTLLTNMLRSSS